MPRTRSASVLAAVALAACTATAAAHPKPAPAPRPTADVLAAPSPVLGTDHRRHLVYEIVLHNPTATRATVERAVVLDRRRNTTIESYEGQGLTQLLGPFGRPVVAEPTVEPGQDARLYFDVKLPEAARVPARLAHRITLSLPPRRVVLTDADARVDRRPPVRLSPPLRAGGLLGVAAHTPVAVDGRLSHAQRFAIDYAQLNEAGDDVLSGDPSRNESYEVYGEEILAAGDGTVVATRDDMAENAPGSEPPFTSWDTVAGNRVVEALGHGRYALYAHMQPGSVRPHVGDRVRRGDVIGLVGNTGNSDAPHLHFHVMDGPGGASALDANGLPYVFDRFELIGNIPDLSAPVLVPADPPGERNDEYPLTGDIASFP